jgi:hypothetical protein
MDFFNNLLDTLSRQLEAKSERLELVKTVLLDRQLRASVAPLG